MKRFKKEIKEEARYWVLASINEAQYKIIEHGYFNSQVEEPDDGDYEDDDELVEAIQKIGDSLARRWNLKNCYDFNRD